MATHCAGCKRTSKRDKSGLRLTGITPVQLARAKAHWSERTPILGGDVLGSNGGGQYRGREGARVHGEGDPAHPETVEEGSGRGDERWRRNSSSSSPA